VTDLGRRCRSSPFFLLRRRYLHHWWNAPVLVLLGGLRLRRGRHSVQWIPIVCESA